MGPVVTGVIVSLPGLVPRDSCLISFIVESDLQQLPSWAGYCREWVGFLGWSLQVVRVLFAYVDGLAIVCLCFRLSSEMGFFSGNGSHHTRNPPCSGTCQARAWLGVSRGTKSRLAVDGDLLCPGSDVATNLGSTQVHGWTHWSRVQGETCAQVLPGPGSVRTVLLRWMVCSGLRNCCGWENNEKTLPEQNTEEESARSTKEGKLSMWEIAN